MKAPTIPDTLRLCRICEDDLAAVGGLCVECDRLKYLLQVGEDELPPPLRFVGDGATKTFKRAYGLPCEEAPAPLRITEVPPDAVPQATALPASQERTALVAARARRVVAWVGLLVMVVFIAGWLFGRCGC